MKRKFNYKAGKTLCFTNFLLKQMIIRVVNKVIKGRAAKSQKPADEFYSMENSRGGIFDESQTNLGVFRE
jgi:hypothetical protein